MSNVIYLDEHRERARERTSEISAYPVGIFRAREIQGRTEATRQSVTYLLCIAVHPADIAASPEIMALLDVAADAVEIQMLSGKELKGVVHRVLRAQEVPAHIVNEARLAIQRGQHIVEIAGAGDIVRSRIARSVGEAAYGTV